MILTYISFWRLKTTLIFLTLASMVYSRMTTLTQVSIVHDTDSTEWCGYYMGSFMVVIDGSGLGQD